MCENHGGKVKILAGKIHCWYCGKEIPMDKLKKKRRNK